MSQNKDNSDINIDTEESTTPMSSPPSPTLSSSETNHTGTDSAATLGGGSSVAATIQDTSPSGSGLEIMNPLDGMPLLPSMIGGGEEEEAISSTTGHPKPIRGIELLDDGEDCPAPPAAMLQDSINSAKAKPNLDTFAQREYIVNGHTPPGPAPFTEFEDLEDPSQPDPAAAFVTPIRNEVEREELEASINDDVLDGHCTNQEDERSPHSTLHMVPEAFLVDHSERTVYNATPLEPHLPWWKQRWAKMLGILVLISTTIMAATFVVWSIKSAENLEFELEYEDSAAKVALAFQQRISIKHSVAKTFSAMITSRCKWIGCVC